jgi:[acyl-carrier-protein] S-malonyltransferase
MKDEMGRQFAVLGSLWGRFVIKFLRGADGLFAFVPNTIGGQLRDRVNEIRSIQDVLAAGRAHGTVAVANRNAPGQLVLSGATAAVDAAAVAAREHGARRVIPLEVSAPFHSPLMQPAAAELAEVLAAIGVSAPAFPVWSNARLAPYDGADAIRSGLVAQVTAPVDWAGQIEAMAPAVPGIELAPAGVLRGLCRRILRDWTVRELRAPADLEELAVHA